MKKRGDWLYWTPRVLAILFIIFISSFALDVFVEGYGFWETLLALFMHLIPAYILITALLIAWKWEKAGGIIFIALGMIFYIIMSGKALFISSMIIAGSPILIGFLFLISKLKVKKKKIKVKKAEAKKEIKKAEIVKKEIKKAEIVKKEKKVEVKKEIKKPKKVKAKKEKKSKKPKKK